jgi:sialidase-1
MLLRLSRPCRSFPPNWWGALFTLCLGLAGGLAQAADSTVGLNLDPTRDNPRNSEGSFITLKSGRILFLYTSFYGGAGDESPARIVSVQSDDAGRTWSREPQVVVENKSGANVMSVSLLRLQSGNIALFYLVKNSMLDCRPVMRVSTNEAQQWSEPQMVGEAPGYFVLNNDRVIQLKDGRLVAPVSFHRSRASDPKNYRSLDGRGIALWYLSDDEGKSWREADTWWALPARTTSGFQEPGVVELADGSLFSWMRNDQGSQFGCYSTNRGQSWPLPEATALSSPVSPASIKRLPGSADLLAVYNDHSGQFPFPKGRRSPLVAAVSADNGKTWPRRKLLEGAADGWFCYTAIHFTDDAVLLAYCAGDPKVGHLNRLRIRRITLDWLKSEAP